MAISTIKCSDLEAQQCSIQKNDQNSLKGLAWAATGAAFTNEALSFTAFTVTSAAATTFLASTRGLFGVPLRNSIGAAVPIVAGLAVATVIVDYVAITLAAYCLSNSIYHLGPEYSIVKK